MAQARKISVLAQLPAGASFEAWSPDRSQIALVASETVPKDELGVDLKKGDLELPAWIGQLRGLIELRVYNNSINRLSTEIGNLANLVELHVQHNQLIELPDTIGRLFSLTRLDMQSNKLCELPDTIGRLTNLIDLNLRFNYLVALPASFTELQSLEYLDLRANALTALPDDLDRLSNLRKLDLRWNQLEYIPRGLDALADGVLEKVKETYKVRGRKEGAGESGWEVFDLGDIIVHLFSPDQRDYNKSSVKIKNRNSCP